MKKSVTSAITSILDNEQKLNKMAKPAPEIQMNKQQSTKTAYSLKSEPDVFERPHFQDNSNSTSSSQEGLIKNSTCSYDAAVLNEIDNIMGELNNLVTTINNRDIESCKKGRNKKKLTKSSMEKSKSLKINLKNNNNVFDSRASQKSIKEEPSQLNTTDMSNTSASPTITSLPNIVIQSPVIVFTDSSQDVCTNLQTICASLRERESGITSMISEGFEYNESPKSCSDDFGFMSLSDRERDSEIKKCNSNIKSPFPTGSKSRKAFAIFKNRDVSITKSAECLKINANLDASSLVTPTIASVADDLVPLPAIPEFQKEVKFNWFERLKFSTISKKSGGNKVAPGHKPKTSQMTHTQSFANNWKITTSTPKADEGRISKSQAMSKVYEKAIKLSNSYAKEKKSRQVEKNTIIIKLNEMMWSDLSISDDAYTAILFKMENCISLTQLEELSDLLSICSKLCPPSQDFLLQIEHFINNTLLQKFKDNEYFLATRDLILQMKSGIGSKGSPSPSVDFISQIRESIYNPSMFGISISDLIKYQTVKFPKLQIPWIVYILCNEIIARGGLEAEGMFRISGDTDLVSKIRLKLNKYAPVPSEANAYDCASVLKTWCRELPIPLIPDNLYSKCLENCSNPTEICNIIQSLPEMKQNCICFLVKFIRIFMDPKVIDKTRMPIENLSMIWAPSFLRSPSSDPIGVAAAIGKEKSVTSAIITELNISSVSDLEINGKTSIGLYNL